MLKRTLWRGGAAAVGLYSAVCAVTLWPLLTTPGIVGRHWDWAVPSYSSLLQHMSQVQSSAWTPIGLGSYVRYRYGNALLLFLLGLPGSLGVSGDALGKGLIVSTMLVSGLAMFFLTGEVIRCSGLKRDTKYAYAGRLAAGLVYMLSPFEYGQTIAGDALGLVAYALAPLAVALAVRSVTRSGGVANAIAAGMVFGVVGSCSVQTALFSLLLALTFSLLVGRQNLLRTGRNVAVAAGTGLVCSAFWLGPVLVGLHQTSEAVVNTTGTLNAATIGLERYSSVLSAAVGTSYFTPFYTQDVPDLVVRIWRGVVLWGIAIAVLRLVFHATRGRRLAWYWIGAYFLAVAISAPGSIIGAPVRWLYNLSWFAFFFRTPQHLAFLVAFDLAIIVALASAMPATGVSVTGPARRVSERLRGMRSWRVTQRLLPIGLIGAVVLGYFLGAPYKGYIGPFRETEAEASVNAILSSDTDRQGRVLAFPEGTSRLFDSRAKGPDISLESGDDGDLIWGTHPAITAELKWSSDAEARTLQRLLYAELLGDPERAGHLLRLLSVKYVLVAPWYSPSAGPDYLAYSPDNVKAALRRADYLVPLFDSGGWALYRNTDYAGRVTAAAREQREASGGNDASVASLVALASSTVPSGTTGEPARTDTEVPQPALDVSPDNGSSGAMPASGDPQVSIALDGSSSVSPDAAPLWYARLSQDMQTAVSRPATRVVFQARATRGSAITATVFFGANGASGFETRVAVSGGWRTFSIPLEQLIPFGIPEWSQASYLAIKGVTGSAMSVRAVHLAEGDPGGYRLNGWFVDTQLYPATWNYFDPYPHPFFHISSGYAGHATFTVHVTVPQSGEYAVTALVRASEQSPPTLDEAVDGRQPVTVAVPRARQDLVPLYVADETLSTGRHDVTVGASCGDAAHPSLCELGIYDVVLVEKSATGTEIPDAQVSRLSDTQYAATVDSSGGLTLGLRDAYDTGWMASGVRAGATQRVQFPHIRYAGALNGWVVPPGRWKIDVTYAPQSTYSTAIRISEIGAGLLVLLACSLAWRRPRRSRDGRGTGRDVSKTWYVGEALERREAEPVSTHWGMAHE